MDIISKSKSIISNLAITYYDKCDIQDIYKIVRHTDYVSISIINNKVTINFVQEKGLQTLYQVTLNANNTLLIL